MKTFQELDCWKLARQLRRDTSSIVKTFPEEEKYRLKDQMLRCSRSVTANIAEGFGKFYLKDNIRYCRNSKGSLFELLDHFVVARDEEYIGQKVLEDKEVEINRCLQVLNGYTNYLEKMSKSRKE